MQGGPFQAAENFVAAHIHGQQTVGGQVAAHGGQIGLRRNFPNFRFWQGASSQLLSQLLDPNRTPSRVGVKAVVAQLLEYGSNRPDIFSGGGQHWVFVGPIRNPQQRRGMLPLLHQFHHIKTHGQHAIGLVQNFIDRVRAGQPQRSRGERVIVGQRAFGFGQDNHRRAGSLGQFTQGRVGRVGFQAQADEDDRAFEMRNGECGMRNRGTLTLNARCQQPTGHW